MRLSLKIIARIDSVLRGERDLSRPARIWQLTLILIVAGFFYGAIMGSYGGVGPAHFPQILHSAIKVPLLLLATFALGVPCFFVLHTVLGLRQDFLPALKALASTQAAITIVLASLSPLTALWYVSSRDYPHAILFNAGIFALASFAAQLVLRRLYRPLIQADPRHRRMIQLWLLLYAFVGIQMGWVLRPFIGDPAQPATFFRQNAWTNAYVSVAKIAWERPR